MKQIVLVVETEVLIKFTTLLQNGIYLEVKQGETIGGLLTALPGFTEEYVSQRVQTIFLNGLPADDLQQRLFGTEAVIALSAAMPGLAGAIFRKDGVHASLRTETAPNLSEINQVAQPMTIRLKLFNMIAMERGARILGDGCVIMASALGKFLACRPPLLSAIKTIKINGRATDRHVFTSLLQSEKMIQLTVKESHDS